MNYTQEVKTFLELYSSLDKPKSVRAIAESLSIPEAEVGLAIHNLVREHTVKTATTGCNEGLQYYI